MEQNIENYKQDLKKFYFGYKAIMKHRIDDMCEEDKIICDTYCPNKNVIAYEECKQYNWKIIFFEDSSLLLITNNTPKKDNYNLNYIVSTAISGVLPENKTLVRRLPCKKNDKTIFLMKIEDIN